MTVIEIKPRWGWKVFEAPGVEPVFSKNHAIDYAQNRVCFRSGEIRIICGHPTPLAGGKLKLDRLPG